MAKTKQTSSPKSHQSSWLDQQSAWKTNLIFIGILYIVLLVVFRGIVFDNMIFSDSGDAVAHAGWVKAMEQIETTEHVEPLWIPYIFSGMPVAGAMIFPRDVDYLSRYIVNPLGKILFFGASL